ncbi:hypothetical protein B0A48_08891 [Cryoendolithus antarcticus]|uniref:ER membrane protein complex subunit 3 n=1 Tax=Cryoendolithus antarcticus TaxID=1507870 RepID=A0A1V8T550_9PEZI|nr:hypothetical protein B0A48_08891 [Cryoendolithus antarcticus]
MAGPVEQQIHRDPALFYWILLPITIVMILTGILRHYLSTLLTTTPKKQTIGKLREQRSLLRAQNLRQNYAQISLQSFLARKEAFVVGAKEGKFLADPDARGKARPNPMTDPAMMEGMMGMMKGNVAMMVPQSLIMGWINAFFSGYVIMKLPFPLTPQFKQMLQAGVGTRDLDVRWVSSLSWYFLTLFGLQPVYNFILGSNNAANQMQQQMAQAQMGANPMGGAEDPDKIFAAEGENLEVIDHWCVLDGVEERLLARYEGLSKARHAELQAEAEANHAEDNTDRWGADEELPHAENYRDAIVQEREDREAYTARCYDEGEGDEGHEDRIEQLSAKKQLANNQMAHLGVDYEYTGSMSDVDPGLQKELQQENKDRHWYAAPEDKGSDMDLEDSDGD